MKKRTADQIIKHLAFHVNGDVWKNGHYRHTRNRIYCLTGALAAADLLGKQPAPVPEIVYRKLQRKQLDTHVPGKIVCVTDCPKHAIGFDLQATLDSGANGRGRCPDWVVVQIEKFGHILDVEHALKTSAMFATPVHALAAKGYVNGGCGEEGEHVVTLAQIVKPEHIVCCNNAEFFRSLPPKQRRAVLAFAKKHERYAYRDLKEAFK